MRPQVTCLKRKPYIIPLILISSVAQQNTTVLSKKSFLELNAVGVFEASCLMYVFRAEDRGRSACLKYINAQNSALWIIVINPDS